MVVAGAPAWSRGADRPPGSLARVLALDDTYSDPAHPALVLLHGLATTRAIWRRVVPLLRDERRVVAVDVPGFGASRPAGPGFDLDHVAATVDAGLAVAGVAEPYDLVGHSMGGAVALALARRRADAVSALVLAAPAGLRPLPGPAAAALGAGGSALIALRRRGAPLAATAWGRRLLLAGGAVDGARFSPQETRRLIGSSHGATRVRQALSAVAAADLRDAAAALPVPLGVIRGARDPVVGAGPVRALARRRPDVRHATIPEAGHIVMMERPEAFARELLAMLDALR